MNSEIPTLLTTNADVAAFCRIANEQEFVTLDTEFLRETTYWPKLCLIQIGLKDQAVAIDPLIDGLDLNPVWELISNPEVLKVFHACKQDMELFLKESGRLPTPVFDTQVAAMMLGYGEQIGYDNFIARVLGKQIDKAAQYSNWSQRPLDDQQLTYALGDVTYLYDAYLVVAEELTKRGRRAWVDEELQILHDPGQYQIDPQTAWTRLKIKNRSQLFLAALKCLAEWRERQAQYRDLPRNRILRDDTLVDLAMRRPASVSEMMKLRGVGEGLARGKAGSAILAALGRAANLPGDQIPVLGPRLQTNAGIAARSDMLKTLLKICADQVQIAPRALASASELDALARDCQADVPCMRGWRRDLFGIQAQDLLAGRLWLGLSDGTLTILKASDTGALDQLIQIIPGHGRRV